MSITHSEVRRHPLWREQAAPEQNQRAKRSHGARVVFFTGTLILVLTVLALVLLS